MRWLLFFLGLLMSAEAASLPSIKVGVTAGPHAIIMEHIAGMAKKEGFIVKVIVFNDFVMPNLALSEGSLDVNSFQHIPYLDEYNNQHKTSLKNLAKTILMPLGGYSKKITSVDELKDGAVIAIPNDPTNEARALKLLAKQKLIKLKPGVENPTVQDISENKNKYKIKLIEAPLLPRMLEDVDLCIINTDWVIMASLNPRDALITEEPSKENPYINILVGRSEKTSAETQELIDKLVQIYHSPEIKAFILEKFKGAVTPAW